MPTTMTESILDSVKKLLGVDAEYTVFDIDIAMHINSVFSTLQQLGVGPENSLFITDSIPTWGEFIGDEKNINSVKSYVYLKVRLLFDPPATSFAIAAIEKQAEEFEWRLYVVLENERYKVLNPVVPPTVIVGPPGPPGPPGENAENHTWDLTGGLDFPNEAEPGDVGIDYTTGQVWRAAE